MAKRRYMPRLLLEKPRLLSIYIYTPRKRSLLGLRWIGVRGGKCYTGDDDDEAMRVVVCEVGEEEVPRLDFRRKDRISKRSSD